MTTGSDRAGGGGPSHGATVGVERRGDTVSSSATAVMFSVSFSLASLALPLVALSGGLGIASIGLLVAVSGAAQLTVRVASGPVLRWLPDRTLLIAASLGQAVSYLILLASAHPVVLGLAWALQGATRATFWSASQAHVVRGPGSSLRPMAVLNFYGSLGTLAGPLLAGLLASVSLDLALAVGAAIGLATLGPACRLVRHPPFTPSTEEAASVVWRRPVVRIASWMGVSAGAWRSLVESAVPTVLASAGSSSTTVGLLVAVGNLASLAGAVVVGRLTDRGLVAAYVGTMVLVSAGLGAFGAAAVSVVLAGVLLALAGFGGGALQTLGPALAASDVSPQRRGDAIATYGTARTLGVLVTPAAMAGLVLVTPIAGALAIVGAALVLPVGAAGRLRRASLGGRVATGPVE